MGNAPVHQPRHQALNLLRVLAGKAMARPAPDTSQLNELVRLLKSLRKKSPFTSSDSGAKVYEAYIALTLADKIRNEARRRGRSVTLKLAHDAKGAPKTYVLRGGPGKLTSAPVKGRSLPPTHFSLSIDSAEYEIHSGVRWLDHKNQIAHEADLAIIKLPRNTKTTSGFVQQQLLLTVECKFWGSKVSLEIARNAESFAYFMKPNIHFLVSKSAASRNVVSFFNYYMRGAFNPKGGQYHSDVVTHGSGAQQRFLDEAASSFCSSIGI